MIDRLPSQQIRAGNNDVITLDVACVETVTGIRYGCVLDLSNNFQHVAQLAGDSVWFRFDSEVSLGVEVLASVPSYVERFREEKHYS